MSSIFKGIKSTNFNEGTVGGVAGGFLGAKTGDEISDKHGALPGLVGGAYLGHKAQQKAGELLKDPQKIQDIVRRANAGWAEPEAPAGPGPTVSAARQRARDPRGRFASSNAPTTPPAAEPAPSSRRRAPSRTPAASPASIPPVEPGRTIGGGYQDMRWHQQPIHGLSAADEIGDVAKTAGRFLPTKVKAGLGALAALGGLGYGLYKGSEPRDKEKPSTAPTPIPTDTVRPPKAGDPTDRRRKPEATPAASETPPAASETPPAASETPPAQSAASSGNPWYDTLTPDQKKQYDDLMKPRTDEEAAAVADQAGKLLPALKSGSKTAAKLGAKALPFASIPLSAMDVKDRVQRKDYPGAAISGLSGISSIFPGPGTAASISLDALNTMRDIGAFDKPYEPLTPIGRGIKEAEKTKKLAGQLDKDINDLIQKIWGTELPVLPKNTGRFLVYSGNTGLELNTNSMGDALYSAQLISQRGLDSPSVIVDRKTWFPVRAYRGGEEVAIDKNRLHEGDLIKGPWSDTSPQMPTDTTKPKAPVVQLPTAPKYQLIDMYKEFVGTPQYRMALRKGYDDDQFMTLASQYLESKLGKIKPALLGKFAENFLQIHNANKNTHKMFEGYRAGASGGTGLDIAKSPIEKIIERPYPIDENEDDFNLQLKNITAQNPKGSAAEKMILNRFLASPLWHDEMNAQEFVSTAHEWLQTIKVDLMKKFPDADLSDLEELAHKMYEDYLARTGRLEEDAINEISDFKRREIEHELRHEKNNYAVYIDGRQWKVFGDKQQAENIARSLVRKGKKASVHITGASVSESDTAPRAGFNKKPKQKGPGYSKDDYEYTEFVPKGKEDKEAWAVKRTVAKQKLKKSEPKSMDTGFYKNYLGNRPVREGEVVSLQARKTPLVVAGSPYDWDIYDLRTNKMVANILGGDRHDSPLYEIRIRSSGMTPTTRMLPTYVLRAGPNNNPPYKAYELVAPEGGFGKVEKSPGPGGTTKLRPDQDDMLRHLFKNLGGGKYYGYDLVLVEEGLDQYELIEKALGAKIMEVDDAMELGYTDWDQEDSSSIVYLGNKKNEGYSAGASGGAGIGEDTAYAGGGGQGGYAGQAYRKIRLKKDPEDEIVNEFETLQHYLDKKIEQGAVDLAKKDAEKAKTEKPTPRPAPTSKADISLPDKPAISPAEIAAVASVKDREDAQKLKQQKKLNEYTDLINNIASMNKLLDPNKLDIGQQLKLPNNSMYTVLPGDSLWKIAKQFSAGGGENLPTFTISAPKEPSPSSKYPDSGLKPGQEFVDPRNNPGNLRFYKSLNRPGYVLDKAIGVDKNGFAVFANPQDGLDAMRRQLQIDAVKRGMTGRQLISKYAPSADRNDPETYTKNVFGDLKLDPDQPISPKDLEKIQRLMVRQEHGKEGMHHYFPDTDPRNQVASINEMEILQRFLDKQIEKGAEELRRKEAEKAKETPKPNPLAVPKGVNPNAGLPERPMPSDLEIALAALPKDQEDARKLKQQKKINEYDVDSQRKIEFSKENPPGLDYLYQQFIQKMLNPKNTLDPNDWIEKVNKHYGLNYTWKDYQKRGHKDYTNNWQKIVNKYVLKRQ